MYFFAAVFKFQRQFCLLFLTFFNSVLFAQLKADFTVDNPGGCSPLTVSFKNTTTGASAAAKYNWVLGNSNTSALVNAGATYRDEKTYTITLTVTDGSQTSSASKQITVYKKPSVNFSASKTKGCLPLSVDFTSSATAGDGTISSYFWDFGDGVTEQTTESKYSHTYNFATTASVSLTVTNSNGCFNTFSKSNLIEVLPAIHTGFTADKTILCKTSDAVQFTNTSTGPSDITYLWDFGNGQTSTEKNPSFVYNKKGVFTVKLTAKNSSGCSETYEQNEYINVANFKTDFDVPALNCENNHSTFTNTSTPNPTNSTWFFDNSYYNYGYNTDVSFNTAGSHTIKLTNTYGTCEESITKNIMVKKSPLLTGFIADFAGACGAPVNVNFKDTSKEAISWMWNFNSPYSSSTSTLKEPSFTYTYESYFDVSLTIKNSEGCSAVTTKSLSTFKPNITINIVSSTGAGYSSGCIGLKVKFSASPAGEIKEYGWDFGDGGTAAVAEPEHTFSKPGTYAVMLNYTTTAGCKDVTTAYGLIQVYEKPDVDFSSLSGTTICGQTPVTFSATTLNGSGAIDWYWSFGDNDYSLSYNSSTVMHQYRHDTTYTVTLIAANGACRDTVIKKDYIKVLPPFPAITNTTNTCNGTRGTVAFLQNSEKALGGKWDFGDGSTATFNPGQSTISHTYTRTGSYKVVLAATNGQCTVKDSITAYVLLKQNPLLSSLNTEICASDQLDIKVSNLDTNPYPLLYSYYYYSVNGFQYGDQTAFTGNITTANYYWTNVFTGTLTSLQNGQKDLRAIVTSAYFNCVDTSNFIPLKIKGPEAGYKILNNNVCYKSAVVFADNSKAADNVAIKKWEWSFGNGEVKTNTTNSNVTYIYSDPGQYYPTLKVTDSNGCSSTTGYYLNPVTINGPKAQFSYSPASVTPNTTVTFYNNTIDYNSSSQYKWILPDGSTSTDYYPSYTFTQTGTDTVKLLAQNLTTGCTDTAVKIINVKNVNAAFTYTTSYINNNTCPPVVVKFTNTSLNASSVSWNFGDESTADNQNYPSHTYYNPGVYYVTIYVNDYSGVIDSTTDSVIVKGPYAKLNADVMQGCSSQTVTLTAEVVNAVSYTWDFGDGSLQDTKDTFAVHQYLTAGVYTPSMILKDGGGCSGISDLRNKIVIDSLNIAIRKSPDHICDSANVFFDPKIISLAADELQQPLNYKWQFGTGTATDTANIKTPYFKFYNTGKYAVSLKVTSPYGCTRETTDTVEVFKKVNGYITAPSEICQGASAEFTGTADINTGLGFKWIFNNSNTSNIQNPPPQQYNDSGTYTVSLIVDNSGCYDTVANDLIVRPRPDINLTPAQTNVCLGKSVQLVAGGGTVFSWRADAGLSNYAIAEPVATPIKTTVYKVEVTNSYGCTNTDSAEVIVAAPFKVQIPGEAFICQGKDLQLSASGATSYKWINNTTGLNNTQIANPVANPASAIVYTVAGFDAYNCFSDTATVKVNVAPLPKINAGPDIEMMSGSSQQLLTTASSDVIKWNWSPPDYLSCVNCQSPVTAPRANITYVVTGITQYGCTDSDTLQIKLLCDQSHVYIPSAFTPNGDNKNELFYIKGRGVKMVKSIKIFNRFGEVVFEKTNFQIDDPSSGWNGKVKGIDVNTGAYVYFTEVVCDTGETFSFKGTVMVIR